MAKLNATLYTVSLGFSCIAGVIAPVPGREGSQGRRARCSLQRIWCQEGMLVAGTLCATLRAAASSLIAMRALSVKEAHSRLPA